MLYHDEVICQRCGKAEILLDHQDGETLGLQRRDHARQGLHDDRGPVSYTHLRAHETVLDLVCRLLLEKKKQR